MRQYRRYWIAIPLLVGGIAFGASSAQAQQQGNSSSITVRVVRFWRGNGSTLLEGIIGQPVAQVQRDLELQVRDSAGMALYSEKWTDSVSAQATALAAMNAETTTPLETVLRPGLYTLFVRSAQGDRADSVTQQVRGFDKAPLLSDVLVSAHMRVLSQDESPAAAEMQRGRYAIERGTQVTIFPLEPKLWYYLELYPQGADSIAQLELMVVPRGRDSAVVRVMRNVSVGARGTVDVAAVVVQGLPPNDYNFVVRAKSGGRTEERSTAFTMASFAAAPPAGAAIATGATGSERALYDRYFAPGVATDAQTMDLVEALTVSTPGPAVDRESLKLTTDAKRRFLARYWARVPDPAPATPAHEMLEEFAARVRFVQREFGEKNALTGARTDRGRIYLRYGAPEVRQLLQVPSSSKTVVLWKYTRNKTYKYVFLDERGFEEYHLVYTTDPAERTLHDWQERVNDADVITQIIAF